MLCVLSNAVSNHGAAEVSLCMPETRLMEEKIVLQGQVLPNETVAVTTEPNLIVSRIFVEQGDYVQSGEALLQVDLNSLENRIVELKICSKRSDEVSDVILMQEEGIDSRKEATGEKSSDSSVVESDANNDILEAISRLEEIKSADGCIRSNHDGTIVDIEVQVGEETSRKAVFVISDDMQGYSVSAPVGADTYERLRYAAKAAIEVGGQVFADLEMKVASLGDAPQARVTVAVADLDGDSLFLPATVEVVLFSEEHETCLPLSALYEDGSSAYVYAIDDVGIDNGDTCKARKLSVSISLRAGGYFAVDSNFISSSQTVICSSTKRIENGSIVRIADNGSY